ncbi:hypothetical protein [Intestinimonas butyriciproducens]|uniref:hypothetical protein n=1 Tax=Intestinimonas butyriciproducens TaxID=1297617 RepID=UPI00195A685E|nr:hypothetical protein [Intestinimonas butyriciproducens]MBM6917726.1 hypothetical protein [Intestinimonas butyriciproducens]
MKNLSIVTWKKAEEMLSKGNYLTTVPYKISELEYIRKVELVYRSETYDTYFMLYYCFYVELPEQEGKNGLKTYGTYCVPAVRSDHISNIPTSAGNFNQPKQNAARSILRRFVLAPPIGIEPITAP